MYLFTDQRLMLALCFLPYQCVQSKVYSFKEFNGRNAVAKIFSSNLKEKHFKEEALVENNSNYTCS